MNTNDKELLLKDLSARLPYRVMVNCTLFNKSIIGRIYLLHYDAGLCYIEIDKYPDNWDLYQDFNPCADFEFVKPYLRLMSSMTDEEIKEWDSICVMMRNMPVESIPMIERFVNSKYLDFCNLIPMGLALPATEGMYKTK